MAVLPSDLTYRVGEIRSEWFDGEDLVANLAEWIAQGEEKVPEGSTDEQADAIAKAYAYWRAYDAITLRMAASPDSVNIPNEIARTQVQGRKFFEAAARRWLLAFTEALSAAETVTTGDTPRETRSSRSVAFTVAF